MNSKSGNENEDTKPITNQGIATIHNETSQINGLTSPDVVAENYLVAVESRNARLRRKKLQNNAIVILFVLLVILFIILFILYQYASKHKLKVCETKQCIRSAASFLQTMDQTVDPCEDFYQYACGNWLKLVTKPDDRPAYDWFQNRKERYIIMIRDILATNTSKTDPLPFNQAKHLYASCVDTDAMDAAGLKPIIDFLNSIDLPPIPTYLNLTKIPNGYHFDWWKSVAKVNKKLGLTDLIGFDISVDPKNISVKRITVQGFKTGAFLSSFRHFQSYKNIGNLKKPKERTNEKYTSGKADELNKRIVNRTGLWRLLIIEVFKQILEELDQSTVIKMPKKVKSSNIDKTLEAFIQISLLFSQIEELMDQSSETGGKSEIEYFDCSVDHLQNVTDENFKKENITTSIIWKPFLQTLFDQTNVTLDFDKDLLLLSKSELKYLTGMSLFVAKTPPMLLEIYLWFKVIDFGFLPYSVYSIRMLYAEYYQSVFRAPPTTSESKDCASDVSENMRLAVAYGLIDQEFYRTTQPKAENMLSNIKTSLEDMIISAPWMDLPTKSASIEKVRNMKRFIGFPKWLMDREQLEEYYKGVQIDPEKYIQNMLSISQHAIKKKFNSYRQPYSYEWDISPIEANAYHVFHANTIIIPLIMLEYPFFDLGIQALNYGSLGALLGHEFSHGFDNNGRKYDKHGRMVQWWTNKTIKSFKKETACLSKQYSSLHVDEIDAYVDGILTLNENIADNAGLRSALRGYWREPKERLTLPGLGHLSDEQLFFLAYGNLWCETHPKELMPYLMQEGHTPNHERVRGAIQNTPEFGRAWGCRTNTSMNPVNRCVLF